MNHLTTKEQLKENSPLSLLCEVKQFVVTLPVLLVNVSDTVANQLRCSALSATVVMTCKR